MTTKNQIFTSVLSGSPLITSEKLLAEADIPEVDRVQWRKIDAQLCSAKGLYTNDIQLYKVASAIVHLSQQDLDLSTYIGQIASLKEQFLTVMPLTPDVGAQQTQLDKFFMVLTLIGLRPDLEPIRDQILGSSSVPSLDDVFARLLRLSSTQTLPSASASDSSVLVSHTTSRGGRSGTRGRGQRPHCTYCNKLGHTRDRCYHYMPGNASACLTHTSSLGPWILDSGASDHLSGNKDLFSSITTTSDLPTVTLANGSQTVAKGIGLALPLPSLPLTSVLYTPECPFNLISISKITRRESQGLYHLTSDSSPAVCISTDAPLLIHNRLGHPSLSKFQKMVPRFSTLSSLPCESCQLGKHTRVSFPKRLNNRAKSLFELVHTDVWGPCRTASTLGFQYFVTFIDDYSRSQFTSFMSHHEILHQSSCAHTPQQNGVAERKNRHLVETAHSSLPSFPDQPLYFLPPRVFGCTCFVHILTPGQDKLSAKAMKCLFLGYSRLQKGYRCYSLRLIGTLSPLMSPSLRTHHSFPPLLSLFPFLKSCPFPIVSPPEAMPPRPLQVYHRRPRVVAPLPFPEAPADSLPIPSASPAPALPSPHDLPIAVRKGTRSTRNPHPIYNFLSYHRLSSPYSAFVSAISSVSLPKSTHEALSHPGWRQAMVDEMTALHSNGTWDLVVLPPVNLQLVVVGSMQLRLVLMIASVRLLLSMAAMCSWPLYQLDIKNAFLHGILSRKFIWSNLLDRSTGKTISIWRESQGLYHLTSPSSPATCVSTDAPLLIHSRLGHPRSLQVLEDGPSFFHFVVTCVCAFLSSSVYHRQHRAVAPPLSSTEVPDDSPLVQSISPTPTLSSIDHLPIALRKVGCRWVYTVKVVLMVRSIALRPAWLLKLDIKNALLHGELLEEVYMEQSPGFVAQGESSLACKLRRSLYGLKQSPRAWSGRFSSVVQEFGMLRSEVDHSVFYHHNSSSQCIYLVVYVDDIVIIGNDQEGLEIAQSSSGVVMSQRKYALDILEETGMLECKPVNTPMDPNVKLVPGHGEPLRDPGRYRRLVGKLNYLTITWPDISFPEHQAKVCCMKTGAMPKLLVTEMQTELVHPQIGVPPQGIVFLLEAVFMMCTVSALDPCQRELVLAALDNLSRKLQYTTRSKYLEELIGSILFRWVTCGVSLVALVEIRDHFVPSVEPTYFMQYCCHWLLPALLLHGDTSNLKWVASVAGLPLAVLVKNHFVPIFSVCMHCIAQSHILLKVGLGGKELGWGQTKFSFDSMYPLSATFCHLPLVHQNPLSLFFSRDTIVLAIRNVVDGFLEMEDCPTSVGVVDKINIFRSDRVFMFQFHYSFIVEMHYKVTAAVHHRHKCHRLADIEVLIDVLGHRAAVSSTSK
ncbi:Serine/threonine-protein kinase ATM [Vitis vinifera]|uniref:Serine/threonine-protein kinase ATM n=1 Tax=Vitis vinifera TaxID=29760 RepID=A0A438KAU6_VITVI|nr:Serine/threonine-protein kinase ATM [Vitis vinifera]